MRSDETGLTRLRIVVLAAAGVVLALAASDIFDQRIWSFLLAAVIPSATAMIMCARHFAIRATVAVVSIVLSVALVVMLAGGSAVDVADAFTAGGQRLVSTEWPSPASPDLLGATAVGLAIAIALAAELARHRRWHMLPTLPLLVEYIGIIAASAPGGVRLVWLIPLGLLLVGFATLRAGASLSERLTLLLGERRLIPLIVVTAIVAGAVSLPLSLTARADPRRYNAPDTTAAILEPIEAMLAIREIDPPADLYRIEGDELTRVDRWRTAALQSYDGRRWAPAITIRPLGRTLGPAIGEVIDYDLFLLDADLTMVPLPGRPVTVDALIQTDVERTVVRIDEDIDPTSAIGVRSNIVPTRSGLSPDSISAREIDETVSGLSDIAESLAGDGTIVEQLQQIEQRMRDNFVLDSDAPGGGLQRALIERFLRETQRGNAEQFATAFVLLARALGVDARVATGFVVDATSEASAMLTSADVSIWPEVRVDDGWIAYDPVPLDEISDAAPPPEEPSAQTPAAPQPPIAPPPEPDDDRPAEDPVDVSDAESGLSGVAAWALAVALVVVIVVLPIALIIALIVGAKRRRRRRRLSAASPVDRVRGAWALATDALVDAGQTIDPAATDAEIAIDGGALVEGAEPDLRRLAIIASAATYGSPDEPVVLADEALIRLGAIETALAAARGRIGRLRRRLSLRSLRRSTRSPVIV